MVLKVHVVWVITPRRLVNR